MAEKKNLHRIFIAIEFPDEVISEVARVQEILETRNFIGKMTELENLHLTLKFLGEVEDEKLEKIKKALSEIEFSGFEMRLEKIGCFNYHGKPRIVWIKVAGKGLYDLQNKIDQKLEKLDFKMEERFMSHMTIGRIRYVKDNKDFIDYANNIALKEIKFKVGEFKLKESELRVLGPVYTDIKIYS